MSNLKKILLVDDDDDLREALSEQLVMTEDFDVFEAGDGQQAMVKVKEGLYDLVILDVNMPRMNGFEFLEALETSPAVKQIICIIVMLTTSLDPRDKQRAEASGTLGIPTVQVQETDQWKIVR